MRSLKFTLTSGGVARTITLTSDEYSGYNQQWVKEAETFKNPFSKAIKEKKYGHYLNAVITINAMSYNRLVEVGYIFDTAVTDLQFFPQADSLESFPVMVDGIGYDDFLKTFATSFKIVIQSKKTYDTPVNPPYGTWGDRVTRMSSSTINFLGGTI